MQRTCTVGREGPRSEASRRSDMGRCTVPSEHGYGWAWMGMDGVEAIGVGMMAWSSFAGERASELQAVGREGPRSKDRRGQARSAAVGMLGPAAAVPGGGRGARLYRMCRRGRRAHTGADRTGAAPRWSTHREWHHPGSERCSQSIDVRPQSPALRCTALHGAAGRPHPSPARPPASCCSPTRRAPAGRFVCRARCVART